MIVNGYHPIHKKFEKLLCKTNSFEDGIVVGSGFLANISLIEALTRKKDLILIDSDYHASGNLALNLVGGDVIIFDHNDYLQLEQLMLENQDSFNRIIIAIEGVYSMGGDIAPKEFAQIADKYNAMLIVDEAHSSGVIGENLMGWFDHHNIEIKSNHIKMGTLGKAYGGYGAYILASNHIISYLQNRAKPIIYSTAPSVYETALAIQSLKYIIKNKKLLKEKIKTIQNKAYELTGLLTHSLILPLVFNDNKEVLSMQQKLLDNNILIGAIRQPTVKQAILRIILRVDTNQEDLEKLFSLIDLNNVHKFTNLVRSGFYADAHELLEEDWKFFRKNKMKEKELFYKGVINGATALALIKLKRRQEAVNKTWDCYQRYKIYFDKASEPYGKDFKLAMEVIETLYYKSDLLGIK
jgi:8-amino-7-oxononanoate synthase